MQVFLPLPSFSDSVSVLDNKRLGKQRVEAYQILKALTYPDYGWQNHPCVKQWRGYENALVEYMNKCIIEWKRRGFKNTMLMGTVCYPIVYPWWFGDPKFHASHRAALLYKNYEFYSQYGWNEEPELNYHWPVVNYIKIEK